ncbi:MAG TPA: efflux transporter periplasmic adaptor subunit, partial [Albitalea sp.]
GAAYVWQVKDKTIAKVPVQLGERDPRLGEYPLLGGLIEGDRILRNPGNALVDGQKVEYASAPAAAAAPAPAGS